MNDDHLDAHDGAECVVEDVPVHRSFEYRLAASSGLVAQTLAST
jgi:hypothetical protein